MSYKYQSEALSLQGWRVQAVVDDDGLLGPYVSHADGGEVSSCDADVGDEGEWAERFTTDKIERDHEQGCG